MIPYEKYQQMVRTDADEMAARFDRLRQRMADVNARYSDKEVEEDLRAAQRVIRRRWASMRAAIGTHIINWAII